MKLYKYTVTVFCQSKHSGNMILDSINGGDPYASDFDIEECDETDLPEGVVVRGNGFGNAPD